MNVLNTWLAKQELPVRRSGPVRKIDTPIFSASTGGAAHEKETLRLGVLVSQDGEFDNSGFLPALDLALITIENDASLQYKFDVRIDDSMVSGPTVKPS